MLQNKNHMKSHEKIQTDCMNQMNHIKESLVKVNESRGGKSCGKTESCEKF